jgi:hypothetical protein
MGYLARPLERYVPGGAARPGSFLRRHCGRQPARRARRGPLLGLLFALAVVVANRPRFSHVRDFLVLAAAFTLRLRDRGLRAGARGRDPARAFVRWRGRGVAAFPATAARAGFGGRSF